MALVKEAAKSRTSVKWTDALSKDDDEYFRSVVAEMRNTPGAAMYVVARGVKLELELTVSVSTIVKTLKEKLGR
jgi:hypothetical protein